MSVRLYVGNLPKDLNREELETLFANEVGDLTSIKVVTDRKTGKCRGFGFVTVETDEQADQIIANLNGQVFMDSALKIEKALPKSKEGGEGVEGSPGRANNNTRRNGKGGNKARGGNGLNRSGSQAKSAQPDPRWADELEKLKEMLLAQTQA